MSRPTDPVSALLSDFAALVAAKVLTELRREHEAQAQPAQKAPYLDQRELAAELRVSERTLEKWRRTGQGPRFQRAGKRCIYSREGVTRWLEGATAGTPTVRRRSRRSK